MNSIERIAHISDMIANTKKELANLNNQLADEIDSYSKGFSHMEELIEVSTKSGNTYKATILHNDNLELIKSLIYDENIEALVNLTAEYNCLVVRR